jgi:hypothetical protein
MQLSDMLLWFVIGLAGSVSNSHEKLLSVYKAKFHHNPLERQSRDVTFAGGTRLQKEADIDTCLYT